MRNIILDTNFLLIPYQFHIDIFRGIRNVVEGKYEVFILTGVIEELKTISKNKGKKGAAARLGLNLAEQNHLKEIMSKGNVDNWILKNAKENNWIICTTDIPLKHKLKNNGVKVISLVSKKKIDVV